MRIEDLCPARFCVNLDRRPDRWEKMKTKLAAIQLQVERFPAIDSQRLQSRLGAATRGFKQVGTLANAMNRRLIMRRTALAGLSAVMILEDDVIFDQSIHAKLAAIELPEDWAILYFGCLHVATPTPISRGLVRVTCCYDTHAYAINAHYFRDIRLGTKYGRRNDAATMHNDVQLAQLHTKLPTYATFPNLIWQEKGDSDIARKNYRNYDDQGRQKICKDKVAGLEELCAS